MSNYSTLVEHFSRLHHLQHFEAILSWDAATMMPNQSHQARADAMATLSLLMHESLNSPLLAECFLTLDETALTDNEKSSVREMRRVWQEASCLPADLVKQQSLAAAKCEHGWREQRAKNNWAGFSENLKEVVRLARQEADYRAKATGLGRYDALLDKFEPGMTSKKLDAIFSDLKTWLPQLIQQVIVSQNKQSIKTPLGPFLESAQKSVGEQIMTMLGFDFERGRLDVSAHPFCGGVPEDVRLTTRYSEEDFTQSLMGVVHETGHAKYEQGLPESLRHLPVGKARSTAIHESQSLFMEMQIGRSSEFLESIHRILIAELGDQDALSLDNLQKLYRQVEPSFIRVDADEVTYPAHVMLRYEIEKDLIEAKIEVDDIPFLWQEKMKAYLGVDTEGNFTNGCMQDIHWSIGAFGYFPTYTLGAMYAAQFMATMKKALPNINERIAKGDLTDIQAWLSQHIWEKGCLDTTDDLVFNATGETLNTSYFKEHLFKRYMPTDI
ncbi:carboxypeptidase M32 [Marinomonas sp. 15G1-11]|uniref:Metal-dependent carboxypeptidase n=1 Tax=Marinomonas phaeophyticola TaxID=3004091 RepID=A0ABT4JYY5_9GAMM|nr:carboxypeptidase M32 [Marinomonas sp. 15G1-11]MCZ2723436.1 carboxypeptidase M32 [Marinomonas sp. 15G1-11]